MCRGSFSVLYCPANGLGSLSWKLSNWHAIHWSLVLPIWGGYPLCHVGTFGRDTHAWIARGPIDLHWGDV